MSRTKPQETKAQNPCKKFLKWDSENIGWRYWDKDNETEVRLDAGIPFIVLDSLYTATGFNERKKSGIWSNEVRNTRDSFKIQDKDGVLAEGPWREVKGKTDAKFATSVYAMAKLGSAYELVNFKMSGCSLGPWIDFCESIGGDKNLYGDLVIKVTSSTHEKKGRVEFDAPVFGIVSRELSPAAASQANEMDTILQAYLEVYLEEGKKREEVERHSEETGAFKDDPPAPEPEDMGDVPF